MEVRNPWRANWLDAWFEERNDGMYVLTHNKTNAEKLENYLAESKTSRINLDLWLNNPTKQGLPKSNIKTGDLYYWSPTKDCVAGFVACSDWADFGCDGGPGGSYPSLGYFGLCSGEVNIA